MKPLRRALQILCVLLFGGIGFCQDLPDGQIANRLDAYLKPFVETGNFTGTVLVVAQGPGIISPQLRQCELRVAGCKFT